MKSKCQNFQRTRLTSDARISWLRDVHENQYAWNVIKMKNKFALLITFLRHFLWEIKILRQYMKITHGNFCFWQHLATFYGISVLKKWKKRVSIVKIKKFSPLQNTWQGKPRTLNQRNFLSEEWNLTI